MWSAIIHLQHFRICINGACISHGRYAYTPRIHIMRSKARGQCIFHVTSEPTLIARQSSPQKRGIRRRTRRRKSHVSLYLVRLAKEEWSRGERWCHKQEKCEEGYGRKKIRVKNWEWRSGLHSVFVKKKEKKIE